MKTIKKINSFFSRNPSLFERDIEKDLIYLDSFNKPKDKLERSYFQYQCQKFCKAWYLRLQNYSIFILILFPSIFFFILKGLLKKSQKGEEGQTNNAVHIFVGIKDIIPKRLKDEFARLERVGFAKNPYLKIADLPIILRLLRYINSPFFVFKCIFKIATYRAVIDEYSPKAIICSSEYSFTSSVLTWYCNLNKVSHINVMHGEKLLNIRDSFFEFDKCYVWDKHYEDLFKELRADENQFKIDTPPSLFLKKTNTKPKYEYTYYLAAETKPQLFKIKETLSKLKIHESRICIRPHPRYSDLSVVKKVFKMFKIEKPNDVTIEESVNKTQNIVSLYSTVLYQSSFSGRSIVIDDVSDSLKYQKLSELRFVLVSKPHSKISEMI